MRRTLLFSLLIAAVVVVLAAGSYSAFAGAGPAASVAGAVVGSGGPDGDESGVQDNGDAAEGAKAVAQVIADTFEASQEDVLALHEEGIGFGAIFKLYLLAAAGETTVEELMSAMEGDGGFAFGKLFKEMRNEVAALSEGEDGLPKNLGQAVSGAKKAEKAAAAVAGDEDGDDGPPDHAPAHGRR